MASPSNTAPSPLKSQLRQRLAQLADQRQAPTDQEGYVAERHPLMPELILVWAPCSCVWVGDATDNFITPCGRETCVFKWVEALAALQALHAAEKPAASAAPVDLATSIAPTESPAPTGADILQPDAPLEAERQGKGERE